MLAFWVLKMTVGEAVVGGGTLLLALFTVYLAVETRASARAARTAVETAEEPFVIATPTPDTALMVLREYEVIPTKLPPLQIHRSQDPNGDTVMYPPVVRLRLWNLGSGPAIATALALATGEHHLLGKLLQDYALPPQGVADIEVPSPDWPVSGRPQSGTLTISYRHASGRQYRTTSEVSIGGLQVKCATYERERRVQRRWENA